MDPTPTPTNIGDLNDETAQLYAEIGFEVITALFITLLLVLTLVWALLRSGRYPASISLVIALSLLTIVSIALFSVSGQETLGTLAATGMGALAGAVSAVWTDRRNEQAKQPEEPKPIQKYPPGYKPHDEEDT